MGELYLCIILVCNIDVQLRMEHDDGRERYKLREGKSVEGMEGERVTRGK